MFKKIWINLFQLLIAVAVLFFKMEKKLAFKNVSLKVWNDVINCDII